jgi:phage terminase large subunit GpA-like protein
VLGGESPYPGPYQPERFPFFWDILAALGPEEPARVVVLCGSAQIGKTLLAQIFAAASLDLDPGNLLYVHPTESNAVRYARTKWRPMIQATPRMTDVFESRQSKEGGNSTLFQMRRDGRGSIQLTGANSAASLSMITVKRQVQDDLSKWENNRAGDPESQADSRSKAFADAKIFKLGTPLLDRQLP